MLMDIQNLTIFSRGNVAIDQAWTFFVIDNVVNGFSLHHMNDVVCLKTYDTKPVRMFPNLIVLTEEEAVVVGGGQSGRVHVFDRATGHALQTLQHSSKGRVQTVMVKDHVWRLQAKLMHYSRHMTLGAPISSWQLHQAMEWKSAYLYGANRAKHRGKLGHPGWIRILAGGATDLANSSTVSNNGGGGDPGYLDDGRWTVWVQSQSWKLSFRSKKANQH